MASRLSRLRDAGPSVLIAVGLAWASIAALDPARTTGRVGGPLLALAALGLQRLRPGAVRSLIFPAVLTAALAVGGASRPEFLRADFPDYFGYLRSMAFDRDLDFANEWSRWGFREMPVTPTGHRLNQGSIGPALLWSPFFAAAHGYVLLDRAFGSGEHEADGYSLPYMRSTLVGTVAWVVLGGWLLATVLGRRVPWPTAVLAVLGAIGTSPILFYTYTHPGMSHGLSFGLVCLAVWAADRADREPSLRAWALCGLIVGLIVLVRLQAVVVALLFVPLVLSGLARGRLKPAWLLVAGAVSFTVFSPQLFAWKVIYGHFWTANAELARWARETAAGYPALFEPALYFDSSSPYLWEVLLSANHGFFTWTPGMLIGIVALAFSARRFGVISVGGVLVFIAVAWFNGCLADMSGGDGFGARRFDLVVPFVALGYAVAITACVRFPLLLPAVALGLLTLWNAGFIQLWRMHNFPSAAPLERLAGLQARQLRKASGAALEGLAGPQGRARAYDVFVGEYAFYNVIRQGVVNVTDPRRPWLTGGWSEGENRTGPPQFRWALHPRACVRLPLMVAADVEATVTLRSPSGLASQSMAVSWNGYGVSRFAIGPSWQDVSFVLPEEWAREGENLLCFEFAESLALRRREGPPVAALVRHIRLRSGRPVWPTPIWGARPDAARRE